MVDLPPPVQAMFDATNAEDTDAFLAAFRLDAVLIDWGRTFSGIEHIRTWNEDENIGVHTRIEATDATTDGTHTRVTVKVSGKGYNGGGTFLFETRGRLIQRLTISG